MLLNMEQTTEKGDCFYSTTQTCKNSRRRSTIHTRLRYSHNPGTEATFLESAPTMEEALVKIGQQRNHHQTVRQVAQMATLYCGNHRGIGGNSKHRDHGRDGKH